MSGLWQTRWDGLAVSVKVQPKSRRPGLQGRVESAGGPRLRIGVAEAAEDGSANRAACLLVARALGVPASAVIVVLGRTRREKILHIAGDPVALIAKLEMLCLPS